MVGGQHQALVILTPGEIPATHCTEGWFGHEGRRGRVQKTSHSLGFDPRTVQSRASRQTIYVISAQFIQIIIIIIIIIIILDVSGK